MLCYKFFEDNLRAETMGGAGGGKKSWKKWVSTLKTLLLAEESVPEASATAATAAAVVETSSLESGDDRLAQRFSQLATRSGSESDLSKQNNSISIRKTSYAGFIPSSFMSESCDNISSLANTSASGMVI